MSDYKKVEGLVRVKKKKNFKISYTLYEAKRQERVYEAWDVSDAMDGISIDMKKELRDTDNFIEVKCISEEI